MKPRITIEVTEEGELAMYLNEAGRDLLVEMLKSLNDQCDHFHLGSSGTSEVEISSRPYHPEARLIEAGKVLFRTEEWDRTYFPHVFDQSS